MIALEVCFNFTDWSMFREATPKDQEMNVEYAATVSAFIHKCTENICATKRITGRENEKLWIAT